MSNILEKFLRKQNAAKNNVKKYANVFENNEQELLYYAEHGKVSRELPPQRKEFVHIPWTILKSEMVIPQNYFEIHAEVVFIKEGEISRCWLVNVLKYGLINAAISLFAYQRAAKLLGREAKGRVSPDKIFNLCIAVMLGDLDKADNLFEFLAEAYSRGWLNRSSSHMTDFMLLLYSRYRNNHLHSAIAGFTYQHIVDDWDTSKPDKITAYITLLCDDQVMQVAAPPSKCFFEFNNLNWQFIPYPALMLLALRKVRGIDTPDIEHPAFGKLTDIRLVDGEDVHDDVFEKLTAKLKQQGFDMSTIYS
ncbi:hypothetical protein [Colwellia psychrerythraea]|uniref:Uncharacterized protein n=3 Tax=Colwellia psychrerythraea TaxID=28229 RepID=A0A099KMJ9_COLPS|nr:hypothetical protein [Colwellia psychrerythraea]KGJ91107.1 hypothetical protein GAB14E_3259 [Colwellia psychrerythraea]